MPMAPMMPLLLCDANVRPTSTAIRYHSRRTFPFGSSAITGTSACLKCLRLQYICRKAMPRVFGGPANRMMLKLQPGC